MHPVGTDGLAEVTVDRLDYTFYSVDSRLTKRMTLRMTTVAEESCEAIVVASADGRVRLTLQQLRPQMNPPDGDLDASDLPGLSWNWWSLPVNWIDDGATEGIRDHPVVVR